MVGSSNSNDTAEDGFSGVEMVEIAGGRRCSRDEEVPSSGESRDMVGWVVRALKADWTSRGVVLELPRFDFGGLPSKLGRGDFEGPISRGEPRKAPGLSSCGDGDSLGEFDGEFDSEGEGEGEPDRLPFFFLFAKLFFNHPFALPIRVLSSTSSSPILPSTVPSPNPRSRSALLVVRRGDSVTIVIVDLDRGIPSPEDARNGDSSLSDEPFEAFLGSSSAYRLRMLSRRVWSKRTESISTS